MATQEEKIVVKAEVTELQKLRNNLKEATNEFLKVKNSGTATAAELKKLENNVRSAALELRNANNSVRQLTNNVVQSNRSLLEMGENLTVVVAGLTVMAKKLFDVGLSSAKFQVMRDNFIGTTQDLENFRKATADTVSDKSLLALSNQASDLGISLKDQTILFALAEDAADKYGTTVEEGFQKVVSATEGQVRGLKQVGIQREIYESILKRLAKEHGNVIEKLDAETQKQLKIQAVIEASNITYEEAINKQKDIADEYESLTTTISNLADTWGGELVNSILKFISPMTAIIGLITETKKGFNELKGVLFGLRQEFLSMAQEGNAVDNFIADITGGFLEFLGVVLKAETAIRQLKNELGVTTKEGIAKEPEAGRGTIGNLSTGTSGKTAIEKTQEVIKTLLEIQNDELKKQEDLYKLNEGSLGSQMDIWERILEIQREIIRLQSGIRVGFFKGISPLNIPEPEIPDITKMTFKPISEQELAANKRQAEIDARREELRLTSNMLGYFQEIAGLVGGLPKEFELIFSLLSDFIQGMGGGGSGIFGLLGGIVGNLVLPGLGGTILGGAMGASAGGMVHGGMVHGIGGGGTTFVVQGDLTKYAEVRIMREGNRQASTLKGGTHG